MPILTRSNVLIVLLEYIDLHNLNGSMKQTFARGYPAFYHFISLYFMLSTTIATNYVEFVSIMPVFSSLLLPSYYSNNFASQNRRIPIHIWMSNPWCVCMCIYIRIYMYVCMYVMYYAMVVTKCFWFAVQFC